MIGLIGIRKNTPLEVREKFTINQKKYKEYVERLLEEVREVVILATCNRTEIYFNASFNEGELLRKIFGIFNWDYEYKQYVFITKEQDVYRHLFEVCCGFHSKILGEDQILGQVKDAYEEALDIGAVSIELHRLFQEAITCGKRFRKEAKLFEIPVSSASIVANEAFNHGCTKYMVLGYGELGKLILKYILSHGTKLVYLVVRNDKIKEEITDERVRVIPFEEKNKYIDEVECIIGCTSAPHQVVRKSDINEQGPKLIIYDLSVPRDVEKEVAALHRTEVYNIDTISYINDQNKALRKEKMKEHKFIMNKYLNEYEDWLKLRTVAPEIKRLKNLGNEISQKRIETFRHKSRNEKDVPLAEKLIKSASDFYINRAIEVMKEETLKGCEEECLKIIEKIFQVKK